MYLLVARQVFHLIFIYFFNFNYWKLFWIVLFLLTTLLVSHTQSFYLIILFCIVLLKCTFRKVTEWKSLNRMARHIGICWQVWSSQHGKNVYFRRPSTELHMTLHNIMWRHHYNCLDSIPIQPSAWPKAQQNATKHNFQRTLAWAH